MDTSASTLPKSWIGSADIRRPVCAAALRTNMEEKGHEPSAVLPTEASYKRWRLGNARSAGEWGRTVDADSGRVSLLDD
ncbi:hypothetical protein D9M71_665410 [compost metagenome]